VSFAKGVTCGYVQLGGVVVSRAVADFFEDHTLQCGLTYSGHPLACAAGVACLNFYERQTYLKMSQAPERRWANALRK
jgi:taurine--2-oxoglutarate transaminase